MASEVNRHKTFDPHPYIVSDKGELFHRYYGIGRYDGHPIDVTGLCQEIWLPRETNYIYGRLTQSGKPESVMLEGAAGSGKSAILYGLRAYMRRDGQQYYQIDGHYEKSPAEVVVETIMKARADGSIVVYDSANYLIGKSKKVRGLPVDEHRRRSTLILTSLSEAIDSGVRIVATSHDDQWTHDLADDAILPLWAEVRNKMHRHSVQGVFETSQELSVFYQKSEIPKAEADYLAHLIHNPDFIDYLMKRKGDSKYSEWMSRIFFKYSTAKIVAADKFKENKRLLQLVREHVETNTQIEESLWEEFINFVFMKDYRLLFHSRTL